MTTIESFSDVASLSNIPTPPPHILAPAVAQIHDTTSVHIMNDSEIASAVEPVITVDKGNFADKNKKLPDTQVDVASQSNIPSPPPEVLAPAVTHIDLTASVDIMNDSDIPSAVEAVIIDQEDQTNISDKNKVLPDRSTKVEVRIFLFFSFLQNNLTSSSSLLNFLTAVCCFYSSAKTTRRRLMVCSFV